MLQEEGAGPNVRSKAPHKLAELQVREAAHRACCAEETAPKCELCCGKLGGEGERIEATLPTPPRGCMATRDFGTHHMRVLSLAVASSVGESIVQHARAVKSSLAVSPPAVAHDGDLVRKPAPRFSVGAGG